MLREAGKRDQNVLIGFLEQYANTMPRTMLRYSIEKLSVDQRKIYLGK
jgi:3-methyladenine DNA glycosylase AlkD